MNPSAPDCPPQYPFAVFLFWFPTGRSFRWCLYIFISFVWQGAETARSSSSGGSPPRIIAGAGGGQGQPGSDEKERSLNSDEALEAVEEWGLGGGGGRRDKKQVGSRCGVFDRFLAVLLVVVVIVCWSCRCCCFVIILCGGEVLV